MKKILFIVVAIFTMLFTALFTSCEKEDVGGTATQAMAGDWVITFSNGSQSITSGHSLTFNTSANLPTEIWVSNGSKGLNFKVKTSCDLASMTFQTDGWAENVAASGKARISNGKITPNGVTLPSGRVVDGISYDVELDTDPGVVWHAEGRRYTGFAEDN